MGKRLQPPIARGIGTSLLTLSVLLLAAQPSVAEEKNVERTGVFLERVSTPTCSDLASGITKYAGRVGDYTASWVSDTVVGLGELATGDPDAFIEQLGRTWSDLKTAGTALTDEGGLFLPLVVAEELFGEVLPDSGVSEFLAEGRKATGSIQTAVALEGIGTVEKDLVEISGDIWDVASNIDDPEAFLQAIAEKNQKWNPAGALTYMFTEGDPLKGAEKAADALLRQAEIVTTYVAPYTKAPASMVQGTSKTARIYNKLKKIPGMPGPGVDDFGGKGLRILKDQVKANLTAEFKKAGMQMLRDGSVSEENKAALVALMAVVDARVMAGEVRGDHPLYRAEYRRVTPEWMGDNHADGSSSEWSLWHPTVEDDSDCISLGDSVLGSRNARPSVLYAACGEVVREGKGDWWTRPIDYDLVWGDNCSGGTHDRSIWAPACEKGYVAVGFVASGESSLKPLPNRIACLRDDPELGYRTDGGTAAMKFIADDKGSGGKYDVSVFYRAFANFPLMYAVGGYQSDPKTLQVLASWGWTSTTQGVLWADPADKPDPSIAAERFAEKKRALAASEPTLTHIILDKSNPGYVTYITANREYVQPLQGRYVLHGETLRSPLPRFEWIIQHENGWQGVDSAGWVYFKAGDRWQKTARISTLPTDGPRVDTRGGAEPATVQDAAYAHQVFIKSSPEGRYYITEADEFVLLRTDGLSQILGSRLRSPDERYDWVIKPDAGPWIGVAADGNTWGETPEGRPLHTGSVRRLPRSEAEELAAKMADRRAAAGSRAAEPEEVVERTAQGVEEDDEEDLTEAEAAAYTHEVFPDDAPEGLRFYITGGRDFVVVEADGAVQRVGRLIDSEEERFAGVLVHDGGGRLSIDPEGGIWELDEEGASWLEVGRVTLLGEGAPRRSAKPKKAPAAAYTHEVFFTGGPEGRYYLTPDREFVGVDDEGAVTRLGRLVEPEDDYFAGDLLDAEGDRVHVDPEGVIWGWTEDESWMEIGWVRTLGEGAGNARPTAARKPPSRASKKTPERTVTKTPTRTETKTPTRTATRTEARTSTRTETKTPTRTATKTPTKTPTRTATKTPTRTATKTPERTPEAVSSDYTHQVFLNEAPDAEFYITADHDFVMVDPSGRATRLGSLTATQAEGFVGMIRLDDGENAYYDSQSILWSWDDDEERWDEEGRIQPMDR